MLPLAGKSEWGAGAILLTSSHCFLARHAAAGSISGYIPIVAYVFWIVVVVCSPVDSMTGLARIRTVLAW